MLSGIPLVGLRDECARVRRAVEKGHSLLLLGPPGCGKTTVLRSVLRECSYRCVYLDMPSIPRDLLVKLGQALADLGHSSLGRFIPARENPHRWLSLQSSLHLRGILWSALEAEPVMIVLDHIRDAGANTYRFLQKVYHTPGVSIIAVAPAAGPGIS